MLSDLAFTLALLVGLIALLAAVAWTAQRVFSWIGNRLPWRRRPVWTVGSSLPKAPWWVVDPCGASYRRALRDWGTTIVQGDEIAMGWFEWLFRIVPPVAGVSGVCTIMGHALFTPGMRCMVIIDRSQVTVLDRERQRGVCLTTSWPRQGLRATLDGAVMRILAFESVGGEPGEPRMGAFTETAFAVDLHADAASALVPPGWPGTATLLPQPASGPPG